MASRSSRQKSALSGLHDEVRRLLREGGIFPSPTDRILTAAREMEKRGLITITNREYVRCADPQDRDFPPKNRSCTGRIYLHPGLDEAGHDYRCSECERPVFPDKFGKRRQAELQVGIRAPGVADFIEAELKRLGLEYRNAGQGVFRITQQLRDVYVCVIDLCADAQCLTREWARSQPTVYIGINNKAMSERFLDEAWLVRTGLGDLVCEVQDLESMIKAVANAGPPTQLKNVSIPVFTKGPMPIAVEPMEKAHGDRRFIVEVGEKTVRVDGAEVVAPQAGPRFQIFKALWSMFLEDIQEGRLPDQFRLMNIKAITELLEKVGEKDIPDETSVRRTVNRLQEDIEKSVKKTIGSPIDREDIVQTCRWKGQEVEEYGYRINPSTVVARPFQG